MQQKVLLSMMMLMAGMTVVHAQDTAKVFPGSREIMYEKLKPYVTKLRMTYKHGDTTSEVGVYIDSFAVAVKDGKKFFARYSFLPARKMSDTGYYEQATMQSVSNVEINAAGITTLHYSPDKMTGTFYNRRKDSTTILDQPMASNYFDGYLNDFLPRYLRLKEGYVVKIPLYSFGQKGVTWITARVNGSETVTMINGKTADTWNIQIIWPGSNGSTNLYVTKDTRSIVKMVVRWDNNMMTKEVL